MTFINGSSCVSMPTRFFCSESAAFSGLAASCTVASVTEETGAVPDGDCYYQPALEVLRPFQIHAEKPAPSLRSFARGAGRLLAERQQFVGGSNGEKFVRDREGKPGFSELSAMTVWSAYPLETPDDLANLDSLMALTHPDIPRLERAMALYFSEIPESFGFFTRHKLPHWLRKPSDPADRPCAMSIAGRNGELTELGWAFARSYWSAPLSNDENHRGSHLITMMAETDFDPVRAALHWAGSADRNPLVRNELEVALREEASKVIPPESSRHFPRNQVAWNAFCEKVTSAFIQEVVAEDQKKADAKTDWLRTGRMERFFQGEDAKLEARLGLPQLPSESPSPRSPEEQENEGAFKHYDYKDGAFSPDATALIRDIVFRLLESEE